MKTKEELTELDRKYTLHPFTQLKKTLEQGPRFLVEGSKTRVKDIDGKEYIDAFSSMWNVSIGHRQQPVIDAIKEQLDKIEYCTPFFGFSSPPATELAAKVVSLMPDDWNMGHVLFTCGGSETNDTNFKIARMYWTLKGKTDKKKIISRRFSYHGVTLGSLSATGIEFFKMFFDPLPSRIPPRHGSVLLSLRARSGVPEMWDRLCKAARGRDRTGGPGYRSRFHRRAGDRRRRRRGSSR